MTKKDKEKSKTKSQEPQNSLAKMAENIRKDLIASGSTYLGKTPPIPPGQFQVTFVPKKTAEDESQDEE